MSRFCRILAISYNGSIFQVMMIYWFTLVFVMFTSSDFFFECHKLENGGFYKE